MALILKKMAGTADMLACETVVFPESSQATEQFEGRTPPPLPPPRVMMLPTPIQKAVARPAPRPTRAPWREWEGGESRLCSETENCC